MTTATQTAAHASAIEQPVGEINGSVMSLMRPAIILLVLFSLLTGLLYPAVVTALAQVAFAHEANGSLLREGDRIVGSALIGQAFDAPQYVWSRPSATVPHAYNAGASTGSNHGPLNPALKDAVSARVAALRAADPDNAARVPVDLVTASGSGLDPHITPAAAHYQAARVARQRGMSEAEVHTLIDQHTEGRTFGLLGEPRVNVLLLNRALDHTREAR